MSSLSDRYDCFMNIRVHSWGACQHREQFMTRTYVLQAVTGSEEFLWQSSKLDESKAPLQHCELFQKVQ